MLARLCIGALSCSPDVIDVPRGVADASDGDHDATEFDDRGCTGDHDVPPHALGSASTSTWQVLRGLGSALCEHPMFVELANSLRSATKPVDRERELFPLPVISAEYIDKTGGIAREDIDDVREYFLGVIVGLSWLYGFRGHGMV